MSEQQNEIVLVVRGTRYGRPEDNTSFVENVRKELHLRFGTQLITSVFSAVPVEGVQWCSTHHGLQDEIGSDPNGRCDHGDADNEPCTIVPIFFDPAGPIELVPVESDESDEDDE